jgi:PAS domain S-box-containing protein
MSGSHQPIINFAAGIGIVAASINLWVAALHLSMSLAPGWKRTRLFAGIASTAGLYNVLGVFFSSHYSDGVYLVAGLLTYFVATLHCVAWLWYAYSPDGSLRGLPASVRRISIAAVGVGVLFLVTGVGLKVPPSTVTVAWAGIDYHYPQVTPIGEVYGVALPALLAVALVKLVKRYRAGERTLKWQIVAFAFFACCALEEALVANRAIVFPSLADLAFLGLPIPLTIESLRRIIADARIVHLRADLLNDEVARRTSERNLAQQAQRRAEHEAREIVSSVDVIVWESDAATRRVHFISDGAQRLLGYSPEEWVATPGFWAARLHPEDRDAAVAAEDHAIASRQPAVSEYRMFAADGRTVWFRDIVRPVLSPSGVALSLRGVMVDITAARLATAALLDSEERFRTLFQAATDGVALIRDGLLFQVNQRFCAIFGRSEAELLGRAVADTSPLAQDSVDRSQPARELIERAERGEEQHFRWKHKRPDGSVFIADVSLNRVPLTAGNYLLALVRDVTAQLELEEELRQSQKMEAIGRLAGGIAHDFNNLLTLINGYADLLLLQHPGDDCIAEVRAAGERAVMLTRQLLSFSRKQINEPHPLDLAAFVTDQLDLLRRIIGEDIALECRIGRKDLWVLADAGQLQQVVLNLIVNARDAMPRGGRLTLTVDGADLSEAELAAHDGAAPGLYPRLAVTDTGHGMDEATRKRIFEPFFTTKPVGKGTGLGLAIVYGVVRQCNGWIEVDSEVGRGATFSIYLPRTQQVPPADASGPAPANSAGTETILVVEDNDAVRSFTRTVLASFGYQVIEASGPEQALGLAADPLQSIDMVVSDVVMPDMNGPEMAERLAALRPGLKVLFMSGYASSLGGSERLLEAAQPLLQKPFTPAALAARVREMLGDGDGAEAAR